MDTPTTAKGIRNVPTVLVVFGATGDLMARKIVPALYNLFEQGKLPKFFRIIGFARRELSTDEFRAMMETVLVNHTVDTGSELAQRFLGFFSYQSGQFGHEADYGKLARTLGHIDGEWKVCANKLFYTAVPPEYYESIFTHLAASGLTEPCSPEEGWTRVIVEKPFGKDLATAQKLDALLGQLFHEEQIFRIDHYLAKEMVQNILAFRFSNNLFESTWNRDLIDRIDISLLETLGVEQRGAFYDGVGALRDVGQNHLLQMLAFIIMDHPGDLSASSVRTKRAEALKHVQLSPAGQSTIRAQYTGYRSIQGVETDSETETYFKIQAKLTGARWQGVPVMIESGKRMGRVRKEIIVTFRHPEPCLCPPGDHYRNRIRFTVEPEERIAIEFWSKKPGHSLDIEQRELDFLYRPTRRTGQYVEEYEKLLLDCLTGDQLLYVSTDEVRAMWQLIDPILTAWQTDQVPLGTYLPDTTPDWQLEEEQPQALAQPMIGIIGLGKMGKGIAQHLLEQDWPVVGYNRSAEVTEELTRHGLIPAQSLAELITKLTGGPRIIWLMLPAGEAIDETLFGPNRLSQLLDRGDIVIDGGNSYYEDTVRRAQRLAEFGIELLDAGTSGGPSGARHGASLMVGGARPVFDLVRPLFEALALPDGLEFFEGHGAGHFVKMVHNGIEYGMMQAIAEGFEILRGAEYHLDLSQVARIYNHGSVIESRLVGWLAQAFERHGPELADVTSAVGHTGEGAWTVATAKKLGIPAKIIEGALEFRKQSVADPRYAGRVLSAIREQFGGHAIRS